MNVNEIINHAREHDIRLSVTDGRLDVDAPLGMLTQQIKDSLVKNKNEIIELLTNIVNDTPDSSDATQPFNQTTLDAIRAGIAVQVYLKAVGEWLWLVHGDDEKQKLDNGKIPVFTLREITALADMTCSDVKNILAVKTKFNASVSSL